MPQSLVRNMVELPRTSWVRERAFSCGNRGQLVAHLAGGYLETFQTALLVDHFVESKNAQVKGDLLSDQSPLWCFIGFVVLANEADLAQTARK